MGGLSDSMFLVSIQWLKIPMDGLSDSMAQDVNEMTHLNFAVHSDWYGYHILWNSYCIVGIKRGSYSSKAEH